MCNKTVIANIAVLCLLLSALYCAEVCAGAEKSAPASCTILISSRIKPYMQAVKGVKSRLEPVQDITARYFFIKDISKADVLGPAVSQNQGIMAVGPEALVMLNSWNLGPDVHKFFTMVLDPLERISLPGDFCGLFLTVNPDVQIPLIKDRLPWIKKLGVLFDPENNAGYVTKAVSLACSLGFEVVPIKTTAQSQVPDMLRKNWEAIDALLLIPDASIISSSLVNLIIKEGISNRVPTIGYNHFFIHNGALMAFVYDYEAIGANTADMAVSVLCLHGTCTPEPAGVKVLLNKALADRLDLEIREDLK